MQKLSHQEIVQRQSNLKDQERLPFCVVLNNIRSLYNVGSIFRTADGAGVEKIWLCGITGTPPNNQIAKTALGAQDQVEWEHREDAVSLLNELKEQGYSIASLEQAKNSVSHYDFECEGPVCLVLGNEIKGVCDDVISCCDHCIEIEMAGLKNSLNVSVAFGILAYRIRSFLK